MDTPRICMVFDRRGFVKIVSDVPIRAYWVAEHCPLDRVCELLNTKAIGVEHVHQTLGDSPVGPNDDDTCFGKSCTMNASAAPDSYVVVARSSCAAARKRPDASLSLRTSSARISSSFSDENS